jgi:predicted CopG family antitoxin
MAKTNLEMPKQIKLNDDVYEELTDIGRKNETYSDIVKRLLEFYKKHSSRVK